MEEMTDRNSRAGRAKRRQYWTNHHREIVADLQRLSCSIDDLGVEGELLEVADDSRPSADRLAYYASTGLEGTLSILRELRDRVCGPPNEELSEEETKPDRRKGTQ